MSDLPGEGLSKQQFREFDIPEEDLGYLSQRERFDMLMKLLRDNGLYTDTALYSGRDGVSLRNTKKFRDQGSIWAVTEEQFREGVERHDRLNDAGMNPLDYARTSGDLPTIAIFNRTYFSQIEGENHTELQWSLREGATMEEAAIAVVYLTH